MKGKGHGTFRNVSLSLSQSKFVKSLCQGVTSGTIPRLILPLSTKPASPGLSTVGPAALGMGGCHSYHSLWKSSYRVLYECPIAAVRNYPKPADLTETYSVSIPKARVPSRGVSRAVLLLKLPGQNVPLHLAAPRGSR